MTRDTLQGDAIDRALSEALTQDTETASAGFTSGVLARIEERRDRRPLLGRPSLVAAAAAIVLAVGIALGLGFGDRQGAAPAVAAERERLLQEYSELQRELDQIRQLADESRPVLYLGGNETLDVVYDLRGYEDRLATSGVRPASLPPDRG